jgi:tight adherence protein B
MNENLLLIPIIAVVAVVTLGLFLLARHLVERRQQVLQRRLQQSDSTENILADQIEKSMPGGSFKSTKSRHPLSGRIDQGFIGMVERSGLGLSPDQALGVMCLVGVTLATILYLWREELWLLAVGLIVGMAVPLGWFLFLQARWRRQLQDQLPDAFFLLARSLRAGLNLDQALALLASEGLPPLSDEIRRCVEKINLGLAVPTALQMAARRIQLTDFNVFVSVVTLHRTTGGNLPLLMDRLAASTRDRNQYIGYFRSATALGRVTAIAIGSAVPIIFLGYAFFEPTYFGRFFESSAGVIALCIAFGLEIIGAIWLYLLLRVEY